MINRAWTIYKDNESTFYDYRTNRKHNRVVFWLIMLLAASAATITIPALSKDVLNSVITIQAILIGFSFSVMFFLVQNHKNEDGGSGRFSANIPHEVSLEEQLRQDKLKLLSKELFWNISYFNMIAFASLILALILMIPNIWGRVDYEFDKVGYAIINVSKISLFTHIIAKWMFVFFLIESTSTFLRTVARVNFLFEQKMGHDVTA